MFADGLWMDLGEPDIEARVFKYYTDSDRLAEDNGLLGIVGQTRQWMTTADSI